MDSSTLVAISILLSGHVTVARERVPSVRAMLESRRRVSISIALADASARVAIARIGVADASARVAKARIALADVFPHALPRRGLGLRTSPLPCGRLRSSCGRLRSSCGRLRFLLRTSSLAHPRRRHALHSLCSEDRLNRNQSERNRSPDQSVALKLTVIGDEGHRLSCCLVCATGDSTGQEHGHHLTYAQSPSTTHHRPIVPKKIHDYRRQASFDDRCAPALLPELRRRHRQLIVLVIVIQTGHQRRLPGRCERVAPRDHLSDRLRWIPRSSRCSHRAARHHPFP